MCGRRSQENSLSMDTFLQRIVQRNMEWRVWSNQSVIQRFTLEVHPSFAENLKLPWVMNNIAQTPWTCFQGKGSRLFIWCEFQITLLTWCSKSRRAWAGKICPLTPKASHIAVNCCKNCRKTGDSMNDWASATFWGSYEGLTKLAKIGPWWGLPAVTVKSCKKWRNIWISWSRRPWKDM